MIDYQKITNAFKGFKEEKPFHHCIVENFLSEDMAKSIEQEFISYDSDRWVYYHNPIEEKKALSDWNMFGKNTYNYFYVLNSPEFVGFLSEQLGTKLYPDYGLHGGGLHCHASGGNLNPHLDYSIHPKLGLQRKLNIIFYVSSDLEEEHGGHLGIWDHNPETSRPGNLIKEIAPKFNRAVLFDTTQNSWHGMCRPLMQPQNIYRKSLAVYYLCDPAEGADPRSKALFAPRESQLGDAELEKLIKQRAGL